jgi:coenzyme Q-binding protein COQ10
MTSHTARLRLNYATRQLFDLVADVESYPQFMPWVIAATISRRQDRTIWVEMTIGTGPLRRRFSTVGVLSPPSRIDVSSDDPLFERFKQTWTFESAPEHGTIVEYHVDFKFMSRSLQLLMGGMFADQIDRTAAAFRRRAQQLFGPSAKPI